MPPSRAGQPDRVGTVGPGRRCSCHSGLWSRSRGEERRRAVQITSPGCIERGRQRRLCCCPGNEGTASLTAGAVVDEYGDEFLLETLTTWQVLTVQALPPSEGRTNVVEVRVRAAAQTTVPTAAAGKEWWQRRCGDHVIFSSTPTARRCRHRGAAAVVALLWRRTNILQQLYRDRRHWHILPVGVTVVLARCRTAAGGENRTFLVLLIRKPRRRPPRAAPTSAE